MTDEPKPQGTAAPISHEEAGHIPTEYPWSLEPGMVYYTSPDRGVAIYAHSGPRPLRNELGPGWTPISPTSMRYLWSVGPHPVREAFGSGGLGAAIGERCVSMGVEWDSIGLYRQGFDPKDAPVTVLIVQQESIIGEPCTDMRTHLEHVAHTVRDDIIARGFPDVHVEIVSRLTMRYRTIGSWADFETQVNDVLHPGSSISVEGQEAAGCFSGLVKLTWDDERSKVYGLTSHHLVSVGRADKTAPIRPGDGDPVTIVSPAEKDREFVLAELKRTLGYRDEDVAREEQWKRECGPEKPWDEKSEASLERRRKSAALLREELETLQPLWEEAPYLGKVAWSSGIQDSKGHAMADWALMEIDRERVPVIGSEFEPSNKRGGDAWRASRRMLSPYNVDAPEHKEPWWRYPWDVLNESLPTREVVVPAAEVYRLCESNPPTVVYLHGRASVIEVGVLHDVADLRNCHAPSELDDDDRVFQSTEVVVRDLPRDKWSLHTHVTHFVVSCTDPGGVIRLRDGRVVGFVKGKALAGAPVAYISLAEPLLQRIAETTGAREASFVPCWRDDAKIRREFEEMEERYKAKRGTEMDGIKTADLKFSL